MGNTSTNPAAPPGEQACRVGYASRVRLRSQNFGIVSSLLGSDGVNPANGVAATHAIRPDRVRPASPLEPLPLRLNGQVLGVCFQALETPIDTR